ncbi:NUDIX domain-containing protein [Streptomyces colonosanans]|uniref:Nudix hydrolase domain-containing protein n=1 Tax=Streptomyces colonosanans TaxID=1428652 RepID=A0A1S2PJ99_9ACTN|nr:NUDIX domain-containing protein [Streptomyces colonosanans]OIJ93626.1 hypothetical protein BIV24_11655 [Streptomyces colonosanans]
MTTSRDDLPGTALTDDEYEALRASASLWAGTSVLITDTCGRVLVQKVDYRPQRLLPGGAVDPGESPSRSAARELQEELGVTMAVGCGLAVDWVPPTAPGLSPALRFPGELLFVYDGGTWDTAPIDTIRLPEGEVIGFDFVEPADLPGLMSPGDARRALAALRARTNGAGTVLLEDGRPLPLPGRFPGAYCLVWTVRGLLLAAFAVSDNLMQVVAIATTASALVPLTSISLNAEIGGLPGPQRLRMFTADSVKLHVASMSSMLLLPALLERAPRVGFYLRRRHIYKRVHGQAHGGPKSSLARLRCTPLFSAGRDPGAYTGHRSLTESDPLPMPEFYAA